MSKKNDKIHYSQLSGYEKCLADGFAKAFANLQAVELEYPSEPRDLKILANTIRDLTLAFNGMSYIDAQVNEIRFLLGEVRIPCLAMAGNNPSSLIAPPPPPKNRRSPAQQSVRD